jgi:hypothetical protein
VVNYPPKGVVPPQIAAWAGTKQPTPPVLVPEIAPEPIKLPYKVRGGHIRQAMRARECSCGCGQWIKKADAYVLINRDERIGDRRVGTSGGLRIVCWQRLQRERDPATRVIERDPTRKARANAYRRRSVIEGVPCGVLLRINVERAHKLREIMDWAGHDRVHAILYNMIDASWERWRKRRDAGTLPRKPPPLPPRHYGPHKLKVEGFE